MSSIYSSMDKSFSIAYFLDGDMLSVTFGEFGHTGQGFELNDHIYIRVDKETNQPLGLISLSYSKLIKISAISLSFWNDFSLEAKKLLLTLLSQIK